ncbi:hypothetical protein M2160_000106 [Streptomyces sp. SAI-117]|uniref:hypothetical protein n=1 Tax=Streptomyces sp. SAI-117 TaxID=2940546 RepID=UPI00247436C2|nr:hypothetical protein [Streptomyces sp. SAI-117]MDH6565085.1 hypothetical protein [Streptomyces sp. SAI-117]
MTEPIDSKYDETPLPDQEIVDEDGDGAADPSEDNGKDLSHLVPDTEVVWAVPPSFNIDPTDLTKGGDGPPSEEITEPSGDLRVDLGALRTAEQSMLTEARGAVDKYEEVRALVAAVKDTVFGQGAKDAYERRGDNSNSMAYDPLQGKSVANPFAKTGETFAAEMNPAMERALLEVGATIEKLGEYIALLNHSGQVYAEADRKSRFPAPPPGA